MRSLPSSVVVSLVLALSSGCFIPVGDDRSPQPLPSASGAPIAPADHCSVPARGAEIHSSSYCTRDLVADFSAQSYGTGIKVYAALTHYGSFLELDGGDAMTATLGSETRTLTREIANGSIHYVASFAPSTSTDVTFALVRSAPRTSALTSVVTVPAPFSLSRAPSSFKWHDVIHLSVDPQPTGGSVAAILQGPCVLGTQAVGIETILPVVDGDVTLNTANMGVVTGACDVTVRIRAESTGVMDHALQGNVEGLQERGFVSRIEL
ncbi:MAG: hypothetical protein JWM74_4173 [Myxococcaceae bacterium]|nr:hypothetical protein [Myxococcaceae bacterium]